jgi:nucleotide-binding universal stress UspA family protein
MPEVSTILLAAALDDDNDPSVAAVVQLARAFDAGILLLHVMPEILSERWAHDVTPELVAGLLKALRGKIESAGARVDDAAVLVGRPSYRICQFAEQKRADLVVLGASRGKKPGVQLGVTAFHVLRNAVKPVWLAARREVSELPSSILCPVDGSPASRRALNTAIQWARRFGSSLTALRVSESLPEVYARIARPPEASTDDELKNARSSLDRLIRESDSSSVDLNLQVREGVPHTEIVSVVAELDCDLVVMGTEGMSNYPRALVGSVTQKITRTMPCSVCTVCDEDILETRLNATLDRVTSHMDEGRSMLRGRRWLEALVEYEQCLLDEPTYAPAWDGMAKAYQSLGDLNKADRCREAAWRIRQTMG